MTNDRQQSTNEAILAGATLLLAFAGDRHKVPVRHAFRRMTEPEIRALAYHEWVYIEALAVTRYSRARVTSVKTWKRDPTRAEVRLVHGMRDFFVLSLTDALDRLLVPIEPFE